MMVDAELDYDDPRFGVSPQQADTELEASAPVLNHLSLHLLHTERVATAPRG